MISVYHINYNETAHLVDVTLLPEQLQNMSKISMHMGGGGGGVSIEAGTEDRRLNTSSSTIRNPRLW